MILCTGGCRSGKSDFARLWLEPQAKPRAYLAAGYACDEEMTSRIEAHRARRGEGWTTFEAAPSSLAIEDPAGWIAHAAAQADGLLLDCLTTWLSLCLERGLDAPAALDRTVALLTALATCGKPSAVVTNEIGMGLVPMDGSARAFRDLAGLANQKAGNLADSVVLVVCGQPLWIKGGP